MARKLQKSLFTLSERDLIHLVGEATADLNELRGRKLFVTGGTGFFGKWLLGGLLHADRELSLGLHLTVLSRNPTEFQRRFPETVDVPALTFLQGNVADFSPPDQRFDYILHGAADTTISNSEAEEQKRSRAIVGGMFRMLTLARESGARRLLNVSSGAVYGQAASQPSGAKEEDDEAKPVTVYGEAKRKAELLCRESDVDFVTARAFAFLGPHLPLNAHFAAGNFLRDAQRGCTILVNGDGAALRSYLYPADLIVWLLRILVRGQRARAYNVGSDEVVTTKQLAQSISLAVQPAPAVVVQSMETQGAQNVYLPDISRARTELNLRVTVPLPDAIARTLEFLRISDAGA